VQARRMGARGLPEHQPNLKCLFNKKRRMRRRTSLLYPSWCHWNPLAALEGREKACGKEHLARAHQGRGRRSIIV
jgi:hypothetical protein